MRLTASDLVLPLHLAESSFLEVLLSNFSLSRKAGDRGVELRVEFDKDTLATWNRKGRETVQKKTPNFQQKAARYKTELDRILLKEGVGTFHHDDPGFPFRWASAGALPVLNIGKEEYYCLFYRDVFPIGWNIANGATDTSAELSNPLQTLERELGEELVIVDPIKKKRYVLRPDKDTLLDRPEFAVFREHWREQYPHLDISRFQSAQLPLTWEAGPDRVRLRMDERRRELEGCFVNINAGDFGIELDKIARITVNKRLVLCDGEVTASRALNRPVGLFKVKRVQQEIQAGRTSFTPDFFYRSGEKHPGAELEPFLSTLLDEISEWRSKPDADRFKNTNSADRLKLCPVTDSIIRRHMQRTRRIVSAHAAEPYEVFVSYAAPDQHLARRVYNALRKRNSRVFFAPTNLQPGMFNQPIYSALQSARVFVGIGTQVEHFERPWPKFEYSAFHMVHLEHLDKHDANIIPFVDRIEAESLPLPLRAFRAIDCGKLGFSRAVKQLLTLIP